MKTKAKLYRFSEAMIAAIDQARGSEYGSTWLENELRKNPKIKAAAKELKLNLPFRESESRGRPRNKEAKKNG